MKERYSLQQYVKQQDGKFLKIHYASKYRTTVNIISRKRTDSTLQILRGESMKPLDGQANIHKTPIRRGVG